MKLLKVIVHTFNRTLLMAILISIFSGGGMAALVAALSQQLTTQEALSRRTVGLLCLFTVFVIGAELTGKWLLTRAIGWRGHRLRMALARQILATPYPRIEAIGKARLQAIFFEDTPHILLALNQIPTLAVALTTLLGSLLYLGWLAPSMLGILLLLAVPTIGGHWLLQRKAKAAHKAAYKTRNQTNQYYEATIEGWKELKLHSQRRHKFYAQLLEPAATLTQQLGIVSRTWNYMANTWGQSIYFIFILVVLGMATWQPIPNQVIATYALIILYMRSAVTVLLTNTTQWQEAEIACQQLEALGFRLSTHRETATLSTPAQNSQEKVKLDLQGVVYEYKDHAEEHSFTLGPIHLTMQSGELIFFTGGNGSGKTTLIKLLTGLYTPQAGNICWNDEPVSAQQREAYQQLFSVIFADFYLFDQLLGLDVLDEHVQYYLDKLKLAHKVTIHEGRLSTTNLSFGQRKRLALLTAYLEDRPIYIFDEWASGQDPEFRELFYDQLLPELKQKGKLVIVISHDDHYFALADRMIKLDFGLIEADSCLCHQAHENASLIPAIT